MTVFSTPTRRRFFTSHYVREQPGVQRRAAPALCRHQPRSQRRENQSHRERPKLIDVMIEVIDILIEVIDVLIEGIDVLIEVIEVTLLRSNRWGESERHQDRSMFDQVRKMDRSTVSNPWLTWKHRLAYSYFADEEEDSGTRLLLMLDALQKEGSTPLVSVQFTDLKAPSSP